MIRITVETGDQFLSGRDDFSIGLNDDGMTLVGMAAEVGRDESIAAAEGIIKRAIGIAANEKEVGIVRARVHLSADDNLSIGLNGHRCYRMVSGKGNNDASIVAKSGVGNIIRVKSRQHHGCILSLARDENFAVGSQGDSARVLIRMAETNSAHASAGEGSVEVAGGSVRGESLNANKCVEERAHYQFHCIRLHFSRSNGADDLAKIWREERMQELTVKFRVRFRVAEFIFARFYGFD